MNGIGEQDTRCQSEKCSISGQSRKEQKEQKYKDKDIELEYRIEDVNLRSAPSWREILWEILAAPMSREN